MICLVHDILRVPLTIPSCMLVFPPMVVLLQHQANQTQIPDDLLVSYS